MKLENLTSAKQVDTTATINWIQVQQARRNGKFHIGEYKLYPFLHIEKKTKLDEAIVKAWEAMKHHKTVYAAAKIESLAEWHKLLPEGLEYGTGGNHIWFKPTASAERTSIIYFDPYEY